MIQQKSSRGKRPSSPRRKPQNRPKRNEASSYANGPKLPKKCEDIRSISALPVFLLILVTIVAYANAWPDALVWDDARVALSDRFAGIGLDGITRFFTEDVWAVEGFDSGLYRPLLLLSIMLDVRLFGDWAAGYHLVNILLHAFSTVLVYGFIQHLLRVGGDESARPVYVAMLAALVFGVHPIHTEAVNSIFNRSEILVCLGVVGGLWWLLKTHQYHPKKAWFGLSLIYLLVLLCRESGITLPLLAVVLLWITIPGDWLSRLKKCLPVFMLLIPLGVYLALRANALEAPGPDIESYSSILQQEEEPGVLPPAETTESEDANVVTPEKTTGHRTETLSQTVESFGVTSLLLDEFKTFSTQRLIHAIRLWADAVKIMLWPDPLLLNHGNPKTPFWLALALQLTLLTAALAGYAYHRIGMISGLSFFYISLLPSSGLIGVLKYPALAERFLYLPSVGMAIVLAFGIRWLAQRLTLKMVVGAVVVITGVLTPLTWARNSDWASNILLAEADYRKGVKNRFILQALVEHYLETKSYSRALEICNDNAGELKSNWYLSNTCGPAYAHAGRYQDAERILLRALYDPQGASRVHFTLASMYLRLGRKDDAIRHFELGIAAESKPFLKEYLTGFMISELYPLNRSRLLEAREHCVKALQLQPQFFLARQLIEQLDKILGLPNGDTQDGGPGTRRSLNASVLSSPNS